MNNSPLKKLNPVSEEQNHIIQLLLSGDNVAVDACAGSGKSTTILSAALCVPHLRILQLTYNAELRKDVKRQIKDLTISNVKVHTFHSLAVKYYLTSAHTDTGIRKIIFDNMPPRESIPQFDIVVLDESQDMSLLYYQLMVKFTYDMGTSFQLFVLGDYMQGLYQFKGADIRFLTMCDTIWTPHKLLKSRAFHKCTLKTSYRITNQMACFVNEVMLGNNRLVACKDGSRVMYIRNSRNNLEKVVISQINALIDAGICPSNIFVLGASVKGTTSYIRKMENALVEKGIPCHVPMLETEKLDERVINGKVVFSTFHASKGRQRKYVFIVGFDQSYFKLYASTFNTNICPNTLYVGCTRATDQLFLLESDNWSTDRPLEFLKLGHHEMKHKSYIEFRGNPRTIFYSNISKQNEGEGIKENIINICPTDMVKHISENVIEEISPLLDKIFVNLTPELTSDDEIAIPNVVDTGNGQYEDVSDINGIAIPSIYYDHIHNKYCADASNNRSIGATILKQIINESLENTKEHEYRYLKMIAKDLPDECTSPTDYLFLSNVYIACREKLYFRLNQIKHHHYNWLSDHIIHKCLHRLDGFIGLKKKPPSQLLIEHHIVDYDMKEENDKINAILMPHFPDGKKFRFSAVTDLITDKCIWELKCTSTISIEHRLQLVIYSWIWKVLHNDKSVHKPHKKYLRKSSRDKDAIVVNIKTGEMMKIEATFHELTQIVVSLLKSKYTEIQEKTDDQFVDDCLKFLHSHERK